MNKIPALAFSWTGEAMVPRYPKIADKHYVVGENYILAEHDDPSQANRGHFFAVLRESWLNLKEEDAEQFPSVECLRKKALIRCGFRDERSIVCASKAEAECVAAFIRPMDTYAVVICSECVVTVYTAKSQSASAMGKLEFNDSKQKVLDYVSGLIEVAPAALEKAARES